MLFKKKFYKGGGREKKVDELLNGFNKKSEWEGKVCVSGGLEKFLCDRLMGFAAVLNSL